MDSAFYTELLRSFKHDRKTSVCFDFRDGLNADSPYARCFIISGQLKSVGIARGSSRLECKLKAFTHAVENLYALQYGLRPNAGFCLSDSPAGAVRGARFRLITTPELDFLFRQSTSIERPAEQMDSIYESITVSNRFGRRCVSAGLVRKREKPDEIAFMVLAASRTQIEGERAVQFRSTLEKRFRPKTGKTFSFSELLVSLRSSPPVRAENNSTGILRDSRLISSGIYFGWAASMQATLPGRFFRVQKNWLEHTLFEKSDL